MLAVLLRTEYEGQVEDGMEIGPKFQVRDTDGLEQGSGNGFVRNGQILCIF